jgi:multidrug efflux pump subunit AcrB
MVALVFIPLTASRILSKRKIQEPRIIKMLNGKYQGTLKWVLAHRVETFIVLLVILFSSQFASNNIPKTDTMEGNINDFNLRLHMPDNYTLEDAGRLVTRIEDSIKVKAEEYRVRTIDSRYRQTRGPNSGISGKRRNRKLVRGHI